MRRSSWIPFVVFLLVAGTMPVAEAKTQSEKATQEEEGSGNEWPECVAPPVNQADVVAAEKE